jgi:hypothetical protein
LVSKPSISAYLQHRQSLVYDGNPPRIKPAPVDDKESLELELELEKALQEPGK